MARQMSAAYLQLIVADNKWKIGVSQRWFENTIERHRRRVALLIVNL